MTSLLFIAALIGVVLGLSANEKRRQRRQRAWESEHRSTAEELDRVVSIHSHRENGRAA